MAIKTELAEQVRHQQREVERRRSWLANAPRRFKPTNHTYHREIALNGWNPRWTASA
jgi:hypothetical protein